MRKYRAILISLGILFLFLPTFVSSSMGCKFLGNILSKRFHANATIGSMRLHWLGKQRFEDVALNPFQSIGSLSIGKLILDQSLVTFPFLDERRWKIAQCTFEVHNRPWLSGIEGTITEKAESVQLDLSLHQPGIHADLIGGIEGNHLNLQKPLLVQGLLPLGKEVVPAILTIPASSISLEALSEGFDQLSIPCATLQVEKITYKIPKAMRIAMKPLWKRLGVEKKIEVEFAPMEIAINQGTITVSPTEIIVGNSLHFQTWGNIDIPGNEVDMTLAIPSEALMVLLQVDEIPGDLTVKIPIAGELDTFSIDFEMIRSIFPIP